MKRLTRARDQGFTLVELLVVITIMPLIVGAIATGFITTLRNDTSVTNRVSDSHDAQITSAYFERDVQSAQYASTSPSPMCGTTQQLLGLSWTTTASTGTVVTNNVSYTMSPTTSALVRTFCSNGNTSTVPLAHGAFPASPAPSVGSCPGTGFGSTATSCGLSGANAYAAVTLTCTDGSTTCANGATPQVTTPQSAGGTGVSTIRLDVLEHQSNFTYHVTASPRGWKAPANQAGGVAGSPALELTGINPSASLQGSAACSLTINGVASINTSTSGAISLSNDPTFTATDIYSQTPTPVSPVSASPPVIVGPPLADPFASLVPPTTAITDVPVTVKNSAFSASGQLDGIYILNHGMSVSGPVTSGPDGVLLYLAGGSIDLTGTDNVILSKPVADYDPVIIWIAASDTGGSVSLGGNGNVTSIGGTIYAPTGLVSLNGGGTGGGVNASGIVANTLTCQGGGNGVGLSAGPLGTTTTLSSSANPSASGSPVTLKATVASSTTVNSGNVSFTVTDKLGHVTTDCAAPAGVNNSGVATCVTGNLDAAKAPYSVSAIYQGNSTFAPSSAAVLTQNVLIATTTALSTTAPATIQTGASVVYHATVTSNTGSTTPSGSVTFAFTSGGASVSCAEGNTQPLNGSGAATCTTPALLASQSQVSATASFAQNATYLGSTSSPAVVETINRAATTTAVVSSKPSSLPKNAVTFTATVTPTPDAGTVTWAITFGSNGTLACSSKVALANGTASCTVAAHTLTVANSPYTVTATYGGSGNYSGSAGSTQQLVVFTASSTLGAQPTQNGNGGKFTPSATVTGADNGVPTGSVNFWLCSATTTGCTSTTPGAVMSTGTLSKAGKATASTTTSKLTAGSYCFAAYYQGDVDYAASSDTTIDQCFIV
jgi:large repetitive protein